MHTAGAGCHATVPAGRGAQVRGWRAPASTRPGPRGHIWAWALFGCAHTCADHWYSGPRRPPLSPPRGRTRGIRGNGRDREGSKVGAFRGFCWPYRCGSPGSRRPAQPPEAGTFWGWPTGLGADPEEPLPCRDSQEWVLAAPWPGDAVLSRERLSSLEHPSRRERHLRRAPPPAPSGPRGWAPPNVGSRMVRPFPALNSPRAEGTRGAAVERS